jgi:hypothetical protein
MCAGRRGFRHGIREDTGAGAARRPQLLIQAMIVARMLPACTPVAGRLKQMVDRRGPNGYNAVEFEEILCIEKTSPE